MLQQFMSVALSLGSICVVSFVLVSCTSCRRFIAKRKLKGKSKKDKQNEEEKKESVPDTKIDLENTEREKNGNGMPNPAYQEPNPETKKRDAKKEHNSLPVQLNTTLDTIDEVNGNEKKKVSSQSSLGSGVMNGGFEDIQEEDETSIHENVDSPLSEDDSGVGSPPPISPEPNVKEDTSSLGATKSEDEVFLKKEEEKPPACADEKRIMEINSNLYSPEELEVYNDVVFEGEWRRPVALKHLLESGLIDKETADEAMIEAEEARKEMENNGFCDEERIPRKLQKYLCGEEPVAGIIMTSSGERKSIFKSAREGILRRGTAISMLEAQAATGNIIDPVSGRKVSVQEATGLGLLDRVYESVLLRAERAVSGYKFRASDHVLSLYEAMQKGLVVESHGLRLLEAQHATGGVIDHRINVRVPLEVAVERGLLDERLKAKLEDDEGDETRSFFDPNSGQNVTYKELMKRSIIDQDTGLRLYPLEKVLRKRLSYGSSFSGRSSMTSSRAGSRENIPAALASP